MKSKKIIKKGFSSDFSDCGFYRWSLQREISCQKKKIIFVGLNPSNANDFRNDQTLRKLLGFCSSWDYGHLVVVNLFARISSYPSKLKACLDPIGIRNNCELNNRFGVWANNEDWDIWLGWGTKGTFHARNKEVLRVLNDYLIIRTDKFPKAKGPLAIGLTKQGHPMHPLYVPFKTKLRNIGDF